MQPENPFDKLSKTPIHTTFRVEISKHKVDSLKFPDNFAPVIKMYINPASYLFHLRDEWRDLKVLRQSYDVRKTQFLTKACYH